MTDIADSDTKIYGRFRYDTEISNHDKNIQILDVANNFRASAS